MSQKYPMVAAAVAAAIASGYVASAVAAPPTIAAAAASTFTLSIAGSSAAQSSIANAIETDLCGGAANTLVVTSSGDKNFNAYSCTTATAITGVSQGELITIYYRSEGGSVVGALPVVSGASVKRLLLTDGSCTSSGTVGTCAITGTTATNGPNDSWTGAVTPATVQLGVTDVEPAQLTGLDYPSNYSVAAFGSASPAQLAALTKVRAIQQVFGLAVNTTGIALNTAVNGAGIHLSKESVANILSGNYTDWSAVPDAATGAPIATSSDTITRIDREPGSGTRTSANIYFLNYPCSSLNGIENISGETLNYSTGDELTEANTTPGSIAYASIDNLTPPKNTSYTNLVMATINGVTPSTLTAAAGEYDYWFEATLVPNSSTTGNALALSNWLQTDVPKLASAPLATDINVIPNVAGNGPGTVPLTSRTGTATIYLNPFTRGGNSCSVPSETN